MLSLTRRDKARRVGNPWDRGPPSFTIAGIGMSRPLLSHKFLVYPACGPLDILLGGC